MLFSTKSDYVLKVLKGKILEGEYAPGSSIVISKVAEELDMSSIPVREAIKRLESEGLVEFHPHKGAKVTSFNIEQLDEVIHIRSVLEGYACAMAAANLTDKDISYLRELNEELMLLMEAGDDEKFTELNVEFHKYIYDNCPLTRINEMISTLWDGGKFTKSVFAYYPENMKRSCEEHSKIIDAIEAKDLELVEKLMRSHKFKTKHYLEKILR